MLLLSLSFGFLLCDQPSSVYAFTCMVCDRARHVCRDGFRLTRSYHVV